MLDGGNGLGGAALRHHISCATFTLTALGGDAKLKLDFVKTHASAGVACDFTVRDSAADTDDHGMGLAVR